LLETVLDDVNRAALQGVFKITAADQAAFNHLNGRRPTGVPTFFCLSGHFDQKNRATLSKALLNARSK
jgi:hypothetical protein